MLSDSQFKKIIWAYYKEHARKMPWREKYAARDPYRILVSEIMLQQTQVARVEKFYKNFIKQFPDFHALASAKTSDVLRAWQGLGYNRRAIALQKLAKEVIEKHNGRLPRASADLIALPGIGNYTAGAIRAFAFDEPEIFIETNIRRVFIHFFFPSRKKVTDAMLKRCIERTIDGIKSPREWYYALMDYGAMLGESSRKSGGIAENPNRRSAHYARQSAFSGSDREIRGKILRELLAKKRLRLSELSEKFAESSRAASKPDQPSERIIKIIKSLTKEGFIRENGKYIQLTS